MDTIDFSDEHVKELFSRFLMLCMLKQGLTVPDVSSKSGFSDKTINRYLPGPQRALPQSISLNTVNILLKTMGKTYEDFHSYYINHLPKEVDSCFGRVLNKRLMLLERISPYNNIDPSMTEGESSAECTSRILWVDDTPENNSSIIDFMEERGVSVKTVTSTEDALNAFRTGRYDHIISDMGRPESSRAGIELTYDIRVLDKVVPLHIFSGDWAAKHLKQKSLEAGATSITSSTTLLLESLGLAI